MANRLAQSSSPYLLQHANNPVDWYPWGDEALEKAKAENKLIIVSVGYSACHWCHVMEHESFENPEVARVMNRFFVCIKVDREERPDIDQIYMNAVQLMTGRGGWPMNCICLPDQRPIYGGTYFPRKDWMNVLTNLAHFYHTRPQEAVEYAEKLTEGIQQSEKLPVPQQEKAFTLQDLKEIVEPWKMLFDFHDGGHNRAPKFPLPNNWSFLMKYAHLHQDDAALVMTRLTMDKMAAGGIYDHLGGGFARYSVDAEWHIPHFEKMLYDNAQLLSLYADGFKWCGELRYKEVVYETVEWLKREMCSPEGGFYAALDADSEGVEGKFYTWQKEQIETLLAEDAPIFNAYYEVQEEGNWEEEKVNHLHVKKEKSLLAQESGIGEAALDTLLLRSRKKLLEARNLRVRPGLDDKILTSWNALMLKGLCDAYDAFSEQEFLNMALANALFLDQHMITSEATLFRNYKNGKASIPAFLDDYALLIEAFIRLYEVTFDEVWLQKSRQLVATVYDDFYDQETGLFFYTSAKDTALIARKHEVLDNVIPSSNSVMAWNLKKLALLFDDDHYFVIYERMLQTVFPQMAAYASGYSNWASLLLDELNGTYEIAITGANSEQLRSEFSKHYIPNKIILGGQQGSLPLLTDKFTGGNKIFVCEDKTCQLPATSVSDALKQILN